MSANLLRPDADAAASNKFQQIAATAVAAAQTGETNSGTRYDLTNVKVGETFAHRCKGFILALSIMMYKFLG